MSAHANADRALQALATGAFSQDLLDALTGLSLDDKSDHLEMSLLRALSGSGDRKVRNAAALALADLRSEAAPQVIRRLLQAPATRGSRATLLYALGEMGGRLPLWLVVDLVTQDSEGAREELLDLLERGLVEPFPEAERQAATEYLQGVLDKESSTSKRDILQDAIDLLATLPNG